MWPKNHGFSLWFGYGNLFFVLCLIARIYQNHDPEKRRFEFPSWSWYAYNHRLWQFSGYRYGSWDFFFLGYLFYFLFCNNNDENNNNNNNNNIALFFVVDSILNKFNLVNCLLLISSTAVIIITWPNNSFLFLKPYPSGMIYVLYSCV